MELNQHQNPQYGQQPVIVQPAAMYNVVGMDGGPVASQPVLREWSTGLMSCTDDCTGCMYGCFCGGCLMGNIATRLGENSCAPCCIPGAVLALRSKIRAIYGIRGSICNDGCCILPFCGPCAVCQMDRELKAMGVN